MAALDFLSDTCVAGQTILRLVSRGNAIVAGENFSFFFNLFVWFRGEVLSTKLTPHNTSELLRLSAHVPPVFRLPTDGSKAAQADKTPNKYDCCLLFMKTY